MATDLPDHVVFPWINLPVPVSLEFTRPTGEEATALANMSRWTDELRTAIERACFADYLLKIEQIVRSHRRCP